MKPSERLWRTLVRITSVDQRKGIFRVVVPGWNHRVWIKLNLCDLPEQFQKAAMKDFRLHAMVNIGAEKARDLRFSGWMA